MLVSRVPKGETRVKDQPQVLPQVLLEEVYVKGVARGGHHFL